MSKQTFVSSEDGISEMSVSEDITGSGVELFKYDLNNHLISYQKDGTTASYEYYADGKRKSKTVNGTTTDFVWNGDNMIMSGNEKYNCGIDGIESSINGTTKLYNKDIHGNVLNCTDTLGNTVGTYEYDSFGNQLIASETDTNPFRYCGEYVDLETNMVYLRNRYYDPSVGRFISEDPIKDGNNWYIYCNNNPVNYVDPLGLDAIVITNKNSVGVEGVATAGHTSAIYQNADGHWFYTYWGNKAAAVIRIPDTYVKEYRRNGDILENSMDSLADFNKSLNRFLSDNGFRNITSDYTDATYIVGDFTASLDAAYADVNDAATNRFSAKNGLTSLDDGSKIFQGHNSPYNVGYRNCFDKTYASLSKGTLSNGTNVGTYMKNLGFDGGMIPNNAVPKFNEVFMNSSFTYGGAYNSLSNYSTLYSQGSPWAQKWSKANYANSAIGR